MPLLASPATIWDAVGLARGRLVIPTSSLRSNVATRFVVLAFGRSGSTLLVNYLCSHPDVVCYHEPFNQRGWHGRFASVGNVKEAVELIYRRGLSPTVGMRLRSHLGRLRGRKPIWSGQSQRAHWGRYAAVGFKMTVAQALHFHPELWEWLRSDEQTRVVLLRRRNTVSRFISYLVARERGVWHSSDARDVAQPCVRVDPADLLDFAEKQEKQLRLIREGLGSDPWRVVEVTHEELAADPKEVMAELFQVLGVEPCGRLQGQTVRLIRGDVRDAVENYDELARELRGTPLEQWLSPHGRT